MTTLFINNQFTEASTPSIYANDRGLLLGDGLFETLRAHQGRVLFLERHWKRLIQSAKILNIPVTFSLETLNSHIEELLIKNNLQKKDARIRITLTRGISEKGLEFSDNQKPTLLITAQHYDLPEPVDKMIISSIRRNECSPLANIKSLNYLDNIFSLQEAKQNNAEDAILLNTHDSVACSTTGNVFMVHHHQIYTPRLKDGALPGIMRGIILEVAKSFDIKEVEISADDLKNADELFVTNSLVGIRPVLQLEEKLFQSTSEKSLTTTLKKSLNDFIESQP